MIELKNFKEYSLNLKTNEVITRKSGEEEKLTPCKDSEEKCWYLYKNGQKFRKTLWELLLENIDKIEQYCKEKSGKIS